MPRTHIALLEGRPPAYHKTLFDSVHRALCETFNVPEDDRFMTLSEHKKAQYLYGTDYLGIHRSDDLVMIEITCNNTRSVEQKKALYKRIVELLADNLDLRPEDVFIGIVEVAKENWSFGQGNAQYADA